MTSRIVMTAALAGLTLLALACGGDNGPSGSPSRTGSRGAASTSETSSRGKWRTLATMPTPRSEVAAAELNGKIYVIGGFEGDGSPSARVEAYDPETNAWRKVAPLQAPRHHAAALSSAPCS